MTLYFWITSDEDGTHVQAFLKDQLDRRIAQMVADGRSMTFLDKVPPSDKGCWNAPEDSVLIIKGEIVVPRARRQILAYEVD